MAGLPPSSPSLVLAPSSEPSPSPVLDVARRSRGASGTSDCVLEALFVLDVFEIDTSGRLR
jgi:hypothetical protein